MVLVMGTTPSASDPAMLERWVSRGIITTEQADQIRADISAEGDRTSTPLAPRATSLVVEAMGYLGGVIILVALGLVAGQVWADLPTLARLGLAGGVAVLLLAAGAGVRPGLGAPAVRLRAVLWLACSAAVAAFLGLLGDESLRWDGEETALLSAGGCAAVSAVLWWRHRHVLQHLAVLASLLVAAAAATGLLPDPGTLPGLALWGVATGWAVLAWGGILKPQRAGVIIGAVAGVVGAVAVAGQAWGAVLALLTVAAIVLAAVALRDLVLLAVGSVGTFVVLPVVINRFVPGVLPAAVALLVVGLALVATAVITARRRSRPARRGSGRDWSAGRPRLALVVVAVLTAATAAAILGAGLA